MNEVRSAKYFAVLADETSVISNTEQLSIALRYVKEEKVLEQLVAMKGVEDMRGSALSEVIPVCIVRMGLNPNYLVGQGYDGAANMSGRLNGAAALTTRRFPAAIYVHCKSHELNLSLGKACDIHSIKSTLNTLNAIINFFNGSPRQANFLEKAIATDIEDSTKTRLLNYCATRWIQRQDAVEVFLELIQGVAVALEELTEKSDTAAQPFFVAM